MRRDRKKREGKYIDGVGREWNGVEGDERN